MGIDTATAEFLAYCKADQGIDFSETLTLGRMSLYVDRREAAFILDRFGVPATRADFDMVFGQPQPAATAVPFAEHFLRLLGARQIASMDASDYEGASILHDLNRPVPATQNGIYSVVVDGGTLEHVFNFPVAVESCMRMVRKGGHFISIAPANNFFGHGFYQFSSELFFRIFCPENGFEVIRTFLGPEKPTGTWYEVPDPATLRRRVHLRNQVPTFQFFLARKISENAGLHRTPLQSDYSEVLWKDAGDEHWTAHGDARQLRRAAVYRKLAERLPRSMARVLRAWRPIVEGAVKPPFRHESLRRFRPHTGLRKP